MCEHFHTRPEEHDLYSLILFLILGLCIIEGMTKPADVIASLEDLAPLRLAADWDNVGLLVATKRPVIHRVMTCLTLTIDVAREAVSPSCWYSFEMKWWFVTSATVAAALG